VQGDFFGYTSLDGRFHVILRFVPDGYRATRLGFPFRGMVAG
jgi:hypothetical protein